MPRIQYTKWKPPAATAVVVALIQKAVKSYMQPDLFDRKCELREQWREELLTAVDGYEFTEPGGC